MLIILSAQFIGESLRPEFGNIPVSFIPLANRRLYTYQIETMRSAFPERSIMMTIPVNYNLSEAEHNWMDDNGVDLIQLDKVESYGQELYELLSADIYQNQEITFLLGSCLSLEIPKDIDFIGTFETNMEPPMPVDTYGAENDIVWAGIFSVSKPALLQDCLKNEFFEYSRAIKRYSFQKKMIRSKIEKCYNLMNANGYFNARTSFTSERAFNELKICSNVLKKFSSNDDKVRAESNWFKHIPFYLRQYIPQYLYDGKELESYFYSIEYLGAIPLNESFVYGRQTVLFWERVFLKISRFLKVSRSSGLIECAEGAKNKSLFVKKTYSRLDDFVNQTNFNVDKELKLNGVNLPSLKDILIETSEYLINLGDVPALIHGDLCLSNILYDSRTQEIKLIDPRGIDVDGSIMIYGSQLYDVAKLAHSVIGLYDHIIAGQYELSVNDLSFSFRIFGAEDVLDIQNAFRKQIFLPGLNMKAIEKSLPLLFIAMLPLHYDSKSRQMALLANALRLYILSRKI